MRGRAAILAVWLLGLALALLVVVRAHYIADLSGFLPARPTPMQQLLVEQLREGAGARTVMIALEGGTATARAAVSRSMAATLRAEPAFESIANGDSAESEADRRFVFEHRYLLSPAIDVGHFSVPGLHQALAETTDALASPGGEWLKDLVPHDPTGETLAIIDRLAGERAPHVRDGAWVSADGARALMIAQIAAPGSDLDAASTALAAIRAAFAAAARAPESGSARSDAGTASAGAASAGAARPSVASPSAASAGVRLLLSGPPVFAVASRTQIEQAAVRLSIAGSVLVLGVLLSVYRSLGALLLGLAPVASGALVGIAAVALTFGVVHGTTLGFGSTLIGESVDYSIYFFIGASALTASLWRTQLWPTVRLGMLVSVCGFASLVPAGFPGLAQLGVYSIGGLLTAAGVTRFVLPVLRPRQLALRDLTPLGTRCARLLGRTRRSRGRVQGCAVLLGAAAILILVLERQRLWSHELSSLSPIPPSAQQLDARLRADLGAADVAQLIVVHGSSLESVLREAERTAEALAPLIQAHLVGGVDNPANFLPSRQTQLARRASLPDAATLRQRLRTAGAGLALDTEQLEPFVRDVDAARGAALLAPESLRGTSIEAGFEALVLEAPDHWTALLPLHAADPLHPAIDTPQVRAVLAQLPPALPGSEAHVLDLKAESDALYENYLRAALRGAAGGLCAIVLLIVLARRSLQDALRVLAPLLLAVLTVAASLALAGVQLTLMHLVGLLLIVAVGSNYALFFTDALEGPAPLTLASLIVANVSTVLGFGLLMLSHVPVLTALGATVAPGTLLALLLSALLLDRRSAGPEPREAHDA
jgi:predicted exporter